MSSQVSVALTCFNRVEQTIACLQSLRAQEGIQPIDLRVFLVDDGSTDGTADEVGRRFPETVIIHGSGDLYWSGGMRVAIAHAMDTDPDQYLWMNDDVVLDSGALQTLLAAHDRLAAAGERKSIVVGSMRDPDTGELTYGGVQRPYKLRPLRFELVAPRDEPVPSETMNGNVVLLPREVVRAVGNIDAAYRHSMGDLDYGLRARRSGCSVWVAPGTVGTCARNPVVPPGAAPLGEELRRMRSLKGLPPAPWRAFARRWAGPLWPIYYWSPYLRQTSRNLRAGVPALRRLGNTGVGPGKMS